MIIAQHILESAVAIPKPNYNPPFNITRASHSVLHVKDLAKSRAFYVDLIGLVVSDEDKDTIYLRGVAEICHHSLVLKRANAPQAERVGMRCFTEEDLEKAKRHFEKAGLPALWVERPYQGRTLHVSDPLGLPLEFCATMTLKPRLMTSFEHHHGAVPHRIDHFLRAVMVGRDHCRTIGGDEIAEQPELGGKIMRDVGMVIHVVARQVGEPAGCDTHAVKPILIEPV